jgi:CRISPR/Cas system CMR-associated protein Cmr5 small subunit
MSFVQNKEKRSASVKAIDNCVIGKIYNNDLTELLENNNEIGYKLMNNIARKIANDLRITNKNILKLTTALSLVLEE